VRYFGRFGTPHQGRRCDLRAVPFGRGQIMAHARLSGYPIAGRCRLIPGHGVQLRA
jgi:hypothetical protein